MMHDATHPIPTHPFCTSLCGRQTEDSTPSINFLLSRRARRYLAEEPIGRMQKSRKLPSHTSLGRPRRVELRSRTAAFESARIKSYEPSKVGDCCLNGGVWEFGKLGHQMAPFWSEFQVEKNRPELGCRKTPTNQISASKHVLLSRNKIPKIAYHLYGETISHRCRSCPFWIKTYLPYK
jgi:hypothetical protein